LLTSMAQAIEQIQELIRPKAPVTPAAAEQPRV
jgi:hypothetical protein